jgi:hypothetical protein
MDGDPNGIPGKQASRWLIIRRISVLKKLAFSRTSVFSFNEAAFL